MNVNKLWGVLLNNDGTIICDFIGKLFNGKEGKCQAPAIWEHNYNRYYCDFHHKVVNIINRKREKFTLLAFKETLLIDYQNCPDVAKLAQLIDEYLIKSK